MNEFEGRDGIWYQSMEMEGHKVPPFSDIPVPSWDPVNTVAGPSTIGREERRESLSGDSGRPRARDVGRVS